MIDLGTGRYLPDQKQLYNAQGECWELPRSEAQVLAMLIAQRGQPVGKQALRCGDHDVPQFGESAVARAVFQLRHFLGDRDHTLILTVKGVGYRLAPQPRGTSPAEPVELIAGEAPLAEVPTENRAGAKRRLPPHWPRWLAALLILLLLALWHTSRLFLGLPCAPKQGAEVIYQYPDAAPDERGFEVHWYSPIKSRGLDGYALTERIITAIAECDRTPWTIAYIGLSADQQGLSVTLKGQESGQQRLRNLKIADRRLHPDFHPDAWLGQGGLCD